MKSLIFHENKNILFTFLSINFLISLFITPIVLGDSGAYIGMAQSFLLDGIEGNFAHRSPLYAIMLSFFFNLFDTDLSLKLMVICQYLMVGVTSWWLFLIFDKAFSNKSLALFIAIIFNFSLSTLYYANIILTEIITVFLFILSLCFMIRIKEKPEQINFVLLGIVVGLMSLARYNAIPLIVTYTVLLAYMAFLQKTNLLNAIKNLSSFIIPFIILINAWCYYNYVENNFYGLFPDTKGSASRNIIVSSIDVSDTVSQTNDPILKIFLESKAEYEKINPKHENPKGSLASFDIFNVINGLYSGFDIYTIARPKLRTHFGLSDETGEHELNMRLNPFYEEIAAQNSTYILKFRFVSLFSGFRNSAVSLPANYGKTNTNILPAFVFKLYKLIFISISLFVFISGIVFFIKSIRRIKSTDYYLLIMYCFIFSFWGINFVFVTANDANRYKFPAEPLILGIFILIIYNFITSNKVLVKIFSFLPNNQETA